MAPLSAEAIRSTVRSILPRFIAEKSTRAAAMASLREKGLGMRKQDFLRLWSEVAGQAQVAERARFTRREFRPTMQTITPSTKNLTSEYQHIFRLREGVEGEGFKAGDVFSLSSNNLGSVEDMAARLAQGMTASAASAFGTEFQSQDLVYIGTLRRMPGLSAFEG